MGFFTGRVSFRPLPGRWPSPALFGPDHLEKLSIPGHRQAGRAEGKDGTEAGWIAGEDILDLGFDLAKNVVNDALHFSSGSTPRSCPPTCSAPTPARNSRPWPPRTPAGGPASSRRRRPERRPGQRLEAEAKDGRFTRRKAYPLLWDGLSNHAAGRHFLGERPRPRPAPVPGDVRPLAHAARRRTGRCRRPARRG